MLKLKYFAALREALGQADEQLALPSDVDDVGGLRRHLAARGGEWERLAVQRNLRCAVNQAMAADAHPLRGDEEVAFFPPVTGG